MSTESHAEHLERNYRYQRHVYDLTREYYLLGRKRLIAGLDVPKGGAVLEIGCGTALNLIRAARRYPESQLYGVDLSRMMLETAEASLARHNLARRIHLAHGDATDFDPAALLGRRCFERVFFSYSLSMIPPWEAALDHAAPMIAAGGSLHIVDFGGCEGIARPIKRGLYSWLAQFRVMPRESLEAHLTQLAARHQLSLRFERLYRGYSYYAVLERG
ncbi:MAG: class I SAM-dependent methyltransferase [Hyphomicrobiaceae bacterium]|nr:class I SAM-dependent methyltransferase [Hyphomicrobiaceae bacterium]